MSRSLRYAAGTFRPLAENLAHGFAAEHALEFYAAQAVYSFIPKNACSTLRFALARANGAVSSPVEIDWIHHNNYAFRADQRSLQQAGFTFVVLRCPFRRLVSVFLDKIVNRYHNFWAAFPQEDGPVIPGDVTFRIFVDRLARSKLSADIHWRPQVDFLVYEDYDLWMPLEQFRRTCPGSPSGSASKSSTPARCCATTPAASRRRRRATMPTLRSARSRRCRPGACRPAANSFSTRPSPVSQPISITPT
ncbi:sulfotransferase family 2 domain-containing protein [Mangrovicoccus ximenensis]|uniref:sulfotransferase family 2 domain-containing protein n=1 Tax=Mangrovicoccus ximenensis TaxID=1911570 RepID=UPI000D38FE08|nr:sulfotransferase family 2 domain-containing protein [Mangrovicoccus ximenensis]